MTFPCQDVHRGKHLHVHFRGDSYFQMKVTGVPRPSKSILNARVRVSLTFEFVAYLELADSYFEMFKLCVCKVLQAAEFRVYSDNDKDGLDLVRCHKAEHDRVGWCASSSLVVYHRAVLMTESYVDIVAQCSFRHCPVRGDDTHLYQLFQQGVFVTYKSACLSLSHASCSQVEVRSVEWRQNLELWRDILYLGAVPLFGYLRAGFRDCRYQRRERMRKIPYDSFFAFFSLALISAQGTRHTVSRVRSTPCYPLGRTQEFYFFRKHFTNAKSMCAQLSGVFGGA